MQAFVHQQENRAFSSALDRKYVEIYVLCNYSIFLMYVSHISHCPSWVPKTIRITKSFENLGSEETQETARNPPPHAPTALGATPAATSLLPGPLHCSRSSSSNMIFWKKYVYIYIYILYTVYVDHITKYVSQSISTYKSLKSIPLLRWC